MTATAFDLEVVDRLESRRGLCDCGAPVTVLAVGAWKSDLGLEATCELDWAARSQSWRDYLTVAVWRDEQWDVHPTYDALRPVGERSGGTTARELTDEARELLVRAAVRRGMPVADRVAREARFASLAARTSHEDGAVLCYEWIRTGLFDGPAPPRLLASRDKYDVAELPWPSTPWWKYRPMSAPSTSGDRAAYGVLSCLGWVVAASFVLRVVMVLLR